jgi:hypothetical protein
MQFPLSHESGGNVILHETGQDHFAHTANGLMLAD